jgi:hypothetical protein
MTTTCDVLFGSTPSSLKLLVTPYSLSVAHMTARNYVRAAMTAMLSAARALFFLVGLYLACESILEPAHATNVLPALAAILGLVVFRAVIIHALLSAGAVESRKGSDLGDDTTVGDSADRTGCVYDATDSGLGRGQGKLGPPDAFIDIHGDDDRNVDLVDDDFYHVEIRPLQQPSQLEPQAPRADGAQSINGKLAQELVLDGLDG